MKLSEFLLEIGVICCVATMFYFGTGKIVQAQKRDVIAKHFKMNIAPPNSCKPCHD